MASFDSSDLLALFKRYAQRPTTDDITDATIYDRLAKAQQAVIATAAGIYPQAFYSTTGPATLTSASGGAVFTFGTDGNGHAVAPLGQVAVGTSLAAFPHGDWQEGRDFTNEGTQIRLTENRTYSGTVYAHFVPTPADIASGTQPSLRPAHFRTLIVYRAVMDFASEGAHDAALYDAMQARWDREFPQFMLALRNQFRQGGAGPMYWWRFVNQTA